MKAVYAMTNKIPEINIQLKEIKVEPRTIKLKSHVLIKNNHTIITENWIIYMFYKIWWAIKPPKLKCYYSPDVEKELEDAILKEIGTKNNE